jgi:hypothetical protein
MNSLGFLHDSRFELHLIQLLINIFSSACQADDNYFTCLEDLIDDAIGVLFYDIDTRTNRLHRDHCHSRKSLGKEVAMCPNRGGVDVIKQYICHRVG